MDVRGNLTIRMGSHPKRELTRHERVYNVLLLVMSLLAFVSVVAMSVVGYIGTGMYYWTMFVIAIGYWAFKVR